jgi:DNA-binding NarL/FixJ family response regulator
MADDPNMTDDPKMADDPEPHSKRADKRKAAQERRAAKAELSEICFEALAAGWTVQQIAEMRKVSARTVQREIARAADRRRLDAPDRFVHLQVARLTKVLRLADARIVSP